jgi:uncharacterized protein (TIGR02001 family)
VLARRPCLLGAVLTALALCPASTANAQLGASLSLDSDDRFRGLSLSDGRPTLSVNLAYDHASGAYAGISAIGADTAHAGVEALGYTGYVGYAARIKNGPTWDVGAANTDITSYRYGRYRYNYSEVYAGLVGEHVSAHVYYSPDYLGEDLDTVYADLDGTIRPAPQWRLFGHLGVLAAVSGRAEPQGRRQQYDLRIGVAREFKGCEVRLAWTTRSGHLVYPAGYRQSPDALVLGASYFF